MGGFSPKTADLSYLETREVQHNLVRVMFGLNWPVFRHYSAAALPNKLLAPIHKTARRRRASFRVCSTLTTKTFGAASRRGT